MGPDTNYTGLGFIVAGVVLSITRDWLTLYITKAYSWFTKQPTSPRLVNTLKLYLTMTGMVFTVIGVLYVFGVIKQN